MIQESKCTSLWVLQLPNPKVVLLNRGYFNEFKRKELNIFSQGMSHDMKKCFCFVNILRRAYYDVTVTILDKEYTINAAAA